MSIDDPYYVDMFDTIDGKNVAYNTQNPSVVYEVVDMLDANGEETDDPDKAVGGIVKFAEDCFKVFFYETVH